MRWANGQSGKKEAGNTFVPRIQCRSNVFQVKGVPKISAPEKYSFYD
jgi:hypothetical protein